MADLITITGLVATTPRHLMTSEALPITSFRLASTQRRFDKALSKWIDGDTNWFTITTFRQLALNANSSIKKGDRIVVNGRLRIRDWESGERVGTTVEIEAEAIGHDLSWGTSAFSRSMSAAARQSEASAGDAASHGVDDADGAVGVAALHGDDGLASASGDAGLLGGADGGVPGPDAPMGTPLSVPF